ncbi:hypothetical protein ES703_114426 [subsurface metagenome]
MKKKTRHKRRSRSNIFALKTNPARFRRRTKPTEMLMNVSGVRKNETES